MNVTEQFSDLKVADAEVLVHKGSGKVKIRKGQSEELYQEQLIEFRKQGPTINDIDWLKPQVLNDVDIDDKVSVTKYIHLLELLYYERKYDSCLERCQEFISKYNTEDIQLERSSLKKKKSKTVCLLDEIYEIENHCIDKLQVR